MTYFEWAVARAERELEAALELEPGLEVRYDLSEVEKRAPERARPSARGGARSDG